MARHEDVVKHISVKLQPLFLRDLAVMVGVPHGEVFVATRFDLFRALVGQSLLGEGGKLVPIKDAVAVGVDLGEAFFRTLHDRGSFRVVCLEVFRRH